MNREQLAALSNFKRCAETAPEGTHDEAKRLNEVIGETCDQLIRNIKALGLQADPCDLIFAVEASIYNYVKRSNPDATLFPVSEGFGSAVVGMGDNRKGQP